MNFCPKNGSRKWCEHILPCFPGNSFISFSRSSLPPSRWILLAILDFCGLITIRHNTGGRSVCGILIIKVNQVVQELNLCSYCTGRKTIGVIITQDLILEVSEWGHKSSFTCSSQQDTKKQARQQRYCLLSVR